MQNGADDGVRQASLSAVDSGKAAVASAEAAYAALGGSNAAALQQAQGQVDSLVAQINSAQAQINSADAALANLSGSSAADIQAAQSAYDSAASSLRAAQAALVDSQNPTQARDLTGPGSRRGSPRAAWAGRVEPHRARRRHRAAVRRHQ